MLVDLLHELRNKIPWLACKYVTINAASVTLIAIIFKYLMDLSSLLPHETDGVIRMGSMVFIVTMKTSKLSSLESIDNKELITNMIALVVVVITLICNICIQINTRSIFNDADESEHLSSDIGFLAILIIVLFFVVSHTRVAVNISLFISCNSKIQIDSRTEIPSISSKMLKGTRVA
ncbi:hypothetical protein LXL04_020030 [Taraxacum kok-saghyz]